MAGEMSVQSLGTVARVRSGFAFKSEDMSAVGFPIVKIKNIVPPSVDTSDCERVPAEVISSIPDVERYELKEGDTLIAMTGATVGKVGRFPRVRERHFLNQRVGKVYLTKPNAADYRFIYYVLSQDAYVRQIFGTADGSAQANVSGSQIEKIEIPLPPLAQQRAIAHILGTLDDKIELNRRMSETLEAMARALFKSWFVDLDPVRAKAEGRDPGLPQPLADLFPSRLVDSELGEIPEGWEVGVVSDLAKVTSGKRPDVRFADRSHDAAVPLWGGNGPMAFVPEPLFNEPLLLTGRVGTLGSVFRITSPCWPSDNTLVVLANRPYDLEYLFFQLRLIDFASLNRGSTQPLLTQSDLKSQRLLLPPAAVLNYFGRITSSTYKRVDQADEESRALAALRDTLLPKLISGELRVQDAKRFVEGLSDG